MDWIQDNIFKIVSGAFVLFILIWSWVIFGMVVSLSNAIEEAEAPYRNMISKQVVVQSDTLLVTDYSLINEQIVLSDGSKVSFKFAELNMVSDSVYNK